MYCEDPKDSICSAVDSTNDHLLVLTDLAEKHSKSPKLNAVGREVDPGKETTIKGKVRTNTIRSGDV